MALITAAEARALIKGASSADDSLLTTLIGYAGVLIAQYCGYPPASSTASPSLESASYTRYLGDPGIFVDPDDTSRLYLEPWPVTAIALLREDEEEVFGSSSEVSASDYVQRGSRGQILQLKPLNSHGTWSLDRGAIKITFTAGWSTAPDDLKAACIALVRHLFRAPVRAGLESASEGELSENYQITAHNLPDDVRSMLSGHVLPSKYLHA